MRRSSARALRDWQRKTASQSFLIFDTAENRTLRFVPAPWQSHQRLVEVDMTVDEPRQYQVAREIYRPLRSRLLEIPNIGEAIASHQDITAPAVCQQRIAQQQRSGNQGHCIAHYGRISLGAPFSKPISSAL
jgi:hypothetical protein